MANGGIAPGDIVIAFAATKRRPCVVIAILNDGRLMVAPFRGTEPSEAHVRIAFGSVHGKAMRITKDTHFYRKLEFVSEAEKLGIRCPPQVQLDIKSLVGLR